MADLLYCHVCAHEWLKDDRGFECPDCHAHAVELVDHDDDPRDNRVHSNNNSDEALEDPDRNANALPRHQLHNHNPWATGAPDPDEGDISHVTFNPAPGIHIQRTTFRSATPQSQNPQSAFAPLFSSFAGMFNNGNAPPPGFGDNQYGFPPPGPQPFFPNHDHTPFPTHPMNPNGSPRVRTNVRVFGAGTGAGDQSVNSIHAVMRVMLDTLQENAVHANNDPHAQHRGQPEGNPFDFLMQTFNQFNDPASATHGDAVFTDEAMDRIISQIMEQQGGTGMGTGPGPATAAAIAALPKKQADKEMVGTDGKTECSVCMDAVLLGDDVTVLPCKHWFHGECVGAWLKEHDSCPHCRRAIMPKASPTNVNAPHLPRQSPQHVQNPWLHGDSPPQSPRGTTILAPHQILEEVHRMTRPPPQPQLAHGQVLPSITPITQMQTIPGEWNPYIPSGYSGYPDHQGLMHPPPPSSTIYPSQAPNPSSSTAPSPPLPLLNTGSRRQSSSNSPNGNGNGEGSGGSAGSRFGGWWRNIRSGGSSAEQR